jgi:DNA-binding transcriptional MerR regulator
MATRSVGVIPTLTIGQLAEYTGVTIRAVRHYHQLGVLAEPERDASGYRRYDAQAVIDLIRIKTLAAPGVPLVRVRELLDAGSLELRVSIAELDRELARRIEELTEQRRRMADLTADERLYLPAEVVAILDRERELGHSERMIQIERDVWIMAVALTPSLVPEWVAGKQQALDDPDFCRLYLAIDRAMEWDPRDPRLADLAEDIRAWESRRASSGATEPGLAGLMNSHVVGSSPAWQRLARYLA